MSHNWLALPVGIEGINLYIGILGMKLPSFPTKGQLDNFTHLQTFQKKVGGFSFDKVQVPISKSRFFHLGLERARTQQRCGHAESEHMTHY